MSEDWLKLTASGDSETKERAVRLLIDAGSPGVLEEDIPPGKQTPGRCTAYLKKDLSSGIPLLRKRLKRVGWAFTLSGYRNVDWSVKWRKGIRPVRVSYAGRTVQVRPTWSRAEKAPGDIVLEIDPAMAFGTGGHHTTRLCIKALIMVLSPGAGETVLDVGTGTGVLAMAAMKLGALSAMGLDTDPVALKAARKNRRLNSLKVTISNRSVEEISRKFSVVAANIFSEELKRLAPALINRTTPGGHIILSGILKEQARTVAASYTSRGLTLLRSFSSGEWTALVFNRQDKQKRFL